MSKVHEKSKFMEYLRETPLVSFACKKVGISRATYYRWYKDDREFKESVQTVLQQGRENINDLAKATLIKMIKTEHFSAIRFWLQHNDPVFRPVRTEYVDPNATIKKDKHIALAHGKMSEEEQKRLTALFSPEQNQIKTQDDTPSSKLDGGNSNK